MAMDNSPTLDDFPPELVQAVAHGAAEDAERVGLFLSEFGINATPEQPVWFPPEFLLDLGAGLRLLCWEQSGLSPADIAGLPPAHQALRATLLSAKDSLGNRPDAPTISLARRVLAAFIDHFAWTGKVELAADVALGQVDEDAILAALDEFLWDHRPR